MSRISQATSTFKGRSRAALAAAFVVLAVVAGALACNPPAAFAEGDAGSNDVAATANAAATEGSAQVELTAFGLAPHSDALAVGESSAVVTVWRLYNPATSEHLWTTSYNEYTGRSTTQGWNGEGQGWTAPTSGKPVYRLYNPGIGSHHYTASEREINELVTNQGWVYDNDDKYGNHRPSFYSAEAKGSDGKWAPLDEALPVYRLYNEGIVPSQHHLSTSKREYNALPDSGWQQEGTAFYSLPLVVEIPVRSCLEDYSWSEVKAIADKISACASEADALKVAKSYNLVGSSGKLTGNETKKVTLSKWLYIVGEPQFTNDDIIGDYDLRWCEEDFTIEVQILGFWHDDKTSGGKAGITFGFKDIAGQYYMNPTPSNAGGWKSSAMRAWLNGDFYKTLPSDLRAVISAANKASNNTGYIGSEETDAEAARAATAVTVTSDKLWLLSKVECYGDSWVYWVNRYEGGKCSAAVYAAEGTQYQLYSDNGVSVPVDGTEEQGDPILKKTFNGAPSGWFLRSADAVGSTSFRRICSDTTWYIFPATAPCGVVAGFCL